ncbi:HAD-like domain-containing protein [Scheffersomyces amazonensis]|uniref:HAD-like domain-containing protein n=1 Tax=Scheffersomyces amazonensis TaxID=1078765 RepID=UPI00315C6A2E
MSKVQRVNISNSCRLIKRQLSSVSSQSPLMSNPFSIENTHKIRESSSKFNKPNFISFDAFDTLYTPKEPVPLQYHKIAYEQFGIDKPLASIEQEFPNIYKQLLKEFPNYGKSSQEIVSTADWWSELIIRLFNLKRGDEITQTICNRLLDHFSGPEAYKVYQDVIPTLTKLNLLGIKLVISSNSDERIRQVLESLGLMKFFSKDDIYLSYELETGKPAKQFFDKVSTTVHYDIKGETFKTDKLKAEYLEDCWHIGDNYTEDFLGAVRSGWNGILLDREYKSPFFASTNKNHKPYYDGCFTEKSIEDTTRNDDFSIIANNRVVITRMSQLLELFEFNPSQ